MVDPPHYSPPPHLVLGLPDGWATLVLRGVVWYVLSGEGEVVVAGLNTQWDAPRLGGTDQGKSLAG